MRFLVDECTGPAVAEWLRMDGHDVVSGLCRLPRLSVALQDGFGDPLARNIRTYGWTV